MQETFDQLTATPVRRFPLSCPALLTFCVAAMLHGQSFPSGSTGADGNLIANTGVTTFTAAPVGGGSVYNFNTIQIAPGSTLKLSGAAFPGPLYFLAQGAVTVGGTIDLSGQSGSVPTTPAQRTGPTIPGPGGYGGGAASFAGNPALPGLGPAGGGANGNCNYSGQGAGFTGNQFLVPLVGGSGGGGSAGSGGAGGGALLIASSVSITVTGTITANGGSGASGSGGGAGGGVRLVAPTIAGIGAITATGGVGSSGNSGYGCTGANGIVRLESLQNTFTGSTSGNLYLANPFSLFIPASTAQPSLMVTSIGGVPVPSNPTGSFVVPDAVVNSTSPLTVNIQASNIPLGTIPTIYFSTENFPDQKIAANAGLAGTLASSTTTATVTLNPGYSIGFITATWVQ